jgi:hypothetical protein
MSGNIPPSNTRPPTFQVEIPNPRHWVPRWESFLLAHGEWWRRQAGPVYWIPSEVIQALARSSDATHSNPRGRKRLVDVATEAAELAFTALCCEYTPTTVGCQDGSPIQYPLFEEFHTPLLSPELVRQLGWCEAVPGESPDEADHRLREQTDQWNQQLQEATPRGDVYQRLMAGWAANITFRGDYRAELTAIRSRFEGLQAPPALPIYLSELVRSLRERRQSEQIVNAEQVPTELLEDYYKFLLKWQLSHHVTWELPLPLAPQENLSLGVAYSLFGPDWVVPVVPAYAAFPERADRAQVERTMRYCNATAVGLPSDALDDDLAGHDGKDHAHARRFRMYLFEQAVRSRLGQSRGWIERFLTGMSEHFGISEDRVRQHRTSYAHFFLTADPA